MKLPTALQTPEALGAIIRAERRARGLTQVHAAALAGVGSRLWNETENGKRPQLGFDTALRMLHTLGLDLHVELRAKRPSTGNE